MRADIRGALIGAALLVPALAFGAPANDLPLVTSGPAAGGGTAWSVSVQALLLITAIGFLPAALMLMTGFTRIIIVLSLLRHALGTQSSPPNQVIVGLSFFLTLFVMQPVTDRIYAEAYVPYTAGQISLEEGLKRGEKPLRDFMMKQTRKPDLALFLRLANAKDVTNLEQVPLRVLIPAFVTSELKTAFQIGFMVFIPFLIIDLVVASVLMSMGMMMLSPVLISLPFKLMLFVLVDGWTLLVGSLVQSFSP
ncbi:flagellar biosynthetic protein FliP [Betaproteobacteria bacterium GR16-43]|nr:flagellar biosynthetic protein FliP [Betaproteobacteria bacterium GR16-43]